MLLSCHELIQMIPLDGTPYVLDASVEKDILERLRHIEERVALLRKSGTLSEPTLLEYYGRKRFEQVAESNAIEGSTLNVGETELAVLKGVTITGHDPAFVRDAISLDKALSHIIDIARSRSEVSSIPNLLELHSLILGDRPGGGEFRRERVKISGSPHVPPKTWEAVMSAMEGWEAWSKNNTDAPAPIRAAVLHAWLSHIHPFIDGNGRTARAVSNLELVKAGYPPIIIRKKERERYIASLSESDAAGDLSSFIDLVLERVNGALAGLEVAAKKKQAYDPIAIKLRNIQEKYLEVWNKSIWLLSASIELNLSKRLEASSGRIFKRDFSGVADVDDFVTLCAGNSISSSWAFSFSINLPGFSEIGYLAFVGHRSYSLLNSLNREGGPSLHWSIANANVTPKWQRVLDDAPYAKEITTRLGKGDEWVVLLTNDTVRHHTTAELAELISDGMLKSVEAKLTS